MKKLKKIIEDYKTKSRIATERSLRNEFNVEERGGKLWLTHNGVAFIKINGLAQAEDVTKELNKARDCAVEFERL